MGYSPLLKPTRRLSAFLSSPLFSHKQIGPRLKRPMPNGKRHRRSSDYFSKQRDLTVEIGKKACVIYVAATQSDLAAVNERLNSEGFDVCCVLATEQVARSVQSGVDNLPTAVKDCVSNSELCVILLPEREADDEGIGHAAGFAAQMGRRIIGVVAGNREDYPGGFNAAASVIRVASDRLAAAIQGQNIWELPDGTVIPDRTIDHQRCQ